jgi:hypothetical protein
MIGIQICQNHSFIYEVKIFCNSFWDFPKQNHFVKWEVQPSFCPSTKAQQTLSFCVYDEHSENIDNFIKVKECDKFKTNGQKP